MNGTIRFARRGLLTAFAVVLAASPALAMSEADVRAWLASTTQVKVVAHGPGSLPGPYAYVRASEVEGGVDAASAVRGTVANGQEVVVIPLDPDKRMPGMGTWWDVPIAEISAAENTQQTRERYEEKTRTQRSVFV